MRSLCILLSVTAAVLGGESALAQQGETPRERTEQPGRTMRPDDAPKVGDEAPLFKLQSLDGKSETDLASFRDKRPVILLFGSYT